MGLFARKSSPAWGRPGGIGWICGLVALLGACGLQGGAVGRGRSTPLGRAAVDLTGRFHAARESGPYASWTAIVANPRGMPSWSLRSVELGAGMRLVPWTWLRWELGGGLGFGEPIGVLYAETGIYTGFDTAVLLRIPGVGGHDNLLGAAPVGYALDVVVSGRAGYWSRAGRSMDESQRALGLGLGLRVTFFSDLLSAEDDTWEGPWDAE